ncbi:hypothetical protein PF005_g32834 [Phytophthora fragariae]|uniref:Uncharacterized protein n=2 Tax=Phytophthora TaxID=4783 RepID=A0A6A3UYM0_9STRA|nr:hypothetical protein PF003_g5419 [Phytophthora fragariae]KAE9276932.1 hypothetical protein PR003_g28925 [Phytophthora rubi]KAE8949012.1 hypothetical protein PF009_g1415 [Phytophthora fragariae]KAE9029975.1 hypothetical protein PF011_g844 [Phytophthora fragariae]KAE9137899.1 hypothetical protein PF010_g1151 [Phytophthora fragariae]
MVISEVPASPGDITRCLFPAENNKKRKKAEGINRPPRAITTAEAFFG